MKKLLDIEINRFNKDLNRFLTSKIDNYLEKIIFAKSKRLRPLLGILFTKAVEEKITLAHKDLFISIELIHSASLIHDDIIDNAKIRRGEKTLNFKFNNSLAVTQGDLLLSLGMKKLLNTNNPRLQKFYIENIIKMCNGEINQYYSKFKLPSIKEYLTKSKLKTALLFELSIYGAMILSDRKDLFSTAKKFAIYFGTGFQIKNDLENYLTTKEDYKQGIYTAPVIYEKEQNSIEKTKNLTHNYFKKAKKEIMTLPKNIYSECIISILDSMEEY